MTTEYREGVPPEKFRPQLLSDVVPDLCRKMGYHYFRVVDMCLNDTIVAGEGGNLSQDSEKDGGKDESSRRSRFEEIVVEQLARCSA